MAPLPWRAAWHDALYAAERGFYVTRGGPSAHFTTAAQGPTGPVLADALLRLWRRSCGSRDDHPPSVIVDVGAGRGELATALCELAPRVVAVDVVARPEGLDERIEWIRSPGGDALPDGESGLGDLTDALVIAHEWLDVVPCTIAQVDAAGSLREVLVDTEGRESLGGLLSAADREWSQRYWPEVRPGRRVEIGRARDEAWAALVARVRDGLLVAVDYGHVQGERPDAGTLTAYVQGRQCDPVPDGTCDLTAHVAMDSLVHDDLVRQRDVLRGLGVRGQIPDVAQASTDPHGYLADLSRASAETQLLARGGFGDFWWVVRHVLVSTS